MSIIALPVVVQREYNTFLYGALPLCAVLGAGAREWYESRFVQIHLRSAGGPDGQMAELDFTDSFAYEELCRLRYMGRLDCEKVTGPASAMVREAIRDGWYVVAYADDVSLSGREGAIFPHERLYFGYDDDSRTFDVVGFHYAATGEPGAFGKQTCLWDKFDLAFSRLLDEPVAMAGTVEYPIQFIKPLRTGSGGRNVLVEELDGFVSSKVAELYDETRYWWLSGEGHYPARNLGFGLDALRVLLARLDVEGMGSAVGPVEFGVVHFLYEHIAMLRRRVEACLGSRLMEACCGSAIKELEVDANRVRLRWLWEFDTEPRRCLDELRMFLENAIRGEEVAVHKVLDAL